MRKLLAIFLILVMMTYISNVSVLADYVVGQENYGDRFFTQKEISTPVDVAIIYRASRYAVDVVYSDMNIDVKSAIWNVNTYEYDVEMETAEPTITVEVVNHSDLPIKAQITPRVQEGLICEQTFTVAYDENGIFQVPAVRAVGENPPGMTVTSTLVIKPQEGTTWQTYINGLIAKGVPSDGKSIVGSVTLWVSKD